MIGKQYDTPGCSKKGEGAFCFGIRKNGKKTLSQICADVRGLRELSEELRTSQAANARSLYNFLRPSTVALCDTIKNAAGTFDPAS